MAEFKYVTVVYRYIDSDEFREFFKEQVNRRNCAYEENKNSFVQTTSWYDGDALGELDRLQELKKNCSCEECGEIFIPASNKNTLCKDCFLSGVGESI